MKIIICGAGQVGWHIARHLAGERNDVTIIDTNAELIRRATDALDVQGVTGFASHPDVLDRAGARDADLIIAATHSDEVNMVTCQMAHSVFQVPRKIARLRSGAYLDAIYSDLYRTDHLPIDVVISPEREVARARTFCFTRDVEANGTMRRVLNAHGIGLLGASLLTPEAIPFETPARYDRLFFISRNAVRYFVKGGGSLTRVPCDAIGTGTAQELRAHGVSPDFIGDGPDTAVIAARYAEAHGQHVVLFPCAEKGLRTVQNAMPTDRVIDRHVYRMQRTPHVQLPDADIVIVTSPEHANALHGVKELSSFRHRIAMGTSTARRIEELSGADAIVPWGSNEMALLDAVFTIATAP